MVTIEWKKEIIESELKQLKDEIKEQSKNSEDFMNKLERKFREKAKGKKIESYLEDEGVSSHFYNVIDNMGYIFEEERKSDFGKVKYEAENQINEKHDELDLRKYDCNFENILNQLKEKILSDYESNAKKNRGNASFLNKYEENIKEELKQYIDSRINEKYISILKIKEVEGSDIRKGIYDFMENSYFEISNKSKGISQFRDEYVNGIKKIYCGEFLNIEEYYKYFYNILNYKTELFEKENKLEKLNTENFYLQFFLNNYNSVSKISLNEEEFKGKLFDKLEKESLYSYYSEDMKLYQYFLNDLTKIFRDDMENKIRYKFLYFFNIKYPDISEKSDNEEDFKLHCLIELKKDSKLNSHYNDYKILFEESLNSIILIFNNDLEQRTKIVKLNTENAVLKFIFSNYNSINEKSSNFEEFKDNAFKEAKDDWKLGFYCIGYEKILEESLNLIEENFNDDLTKKNELKRLNIQIIILLFFIENYNTISESSLNVEEFKNNFLSKFNQNNELNSNYEEFRDYYEKL